VCVTQQPTHTCLNALPPALTQAGRDLGFVMNPGDGAITCAAFHTPPTPPAAAAAAAGAAAGAAGSAGSSSSSSSSSRRPSHLLTGSDDGSIAVWRAGGDWEALKLLKGHKVRAAESHV
jgi:protein MAK11